MERLSHLPLLVVILLAASHTAGGVMNCIEARHQCLNDKECKDVLKMLHKVCGPELVACSSTTPTKCQMLLRTLRNFDYLTSCKCSEAHLDFTCHSFRETIFSHPCGLVEIEDYPDYMPPLMPNCNDAYDKCKSKGSCLRDYVEFANVCSFSGITCIAQDSEKCMTSWSKIRQSPLFGCICTPPAPMRVLAYGNDMGAADTSLTSYSTLRNGGTIQETCMETYNRTHDNPCLAGQHDITKATLVETSQATCHTALEKCMKDEDCRPLLDDVMVWCEHAHCEPDRCRSALQDFYDRVSIIHRLQVAFCVCSEFSRNEKNRRVLQSDPDGECLTAMRKLHPTCAERHSGRDPMKCHKIAEQCRKSPICREKLREYEQKCAADAMTGRCADTHRSCQKAVMNILGTELHATCVCKGTDFLHQHDCYTWQKLLWSNPCVIESHLMLHKEIAEGASDSLDEVFRRPTQRTTPQPRLPFINPTPEEDDEFARPPGSYGIVHEISPDGSVPRPSGTSYGMERKGPWDRRPGASGGGRNRGRDDGDEREHLGMGRNGGSRGGGLLGGENGRGSGLSIVRGNGRGRGGAGESELGRGEMGRGGIGRGEIGLDNGNSRGYPQILSPGEFPETKWTSGRTRGGGLSVARNGARNGGLGSHFGGNQEETGNGGRGRVTGLNIDVGRERERERDRMGGAGGYDPGQPGNGYGNRGRGSAGTGHRGTQITIGSPDRGSGSFPRGRDRNNFGRGHLGGGRPGGSWRPSGGEHPDPDGGVVPDERGHYEPVTPPAFEGIPPTPPAMPAPTSQISTTTEIPTTTMPRRTCSIKNIKNEQLMNLEIPEGSRKRIYNTSDCSELCECRAPNRAAKPEAICTTLRCIENKSCNTESAEFPHSAPYYLAYRGVCDCYAGNFICQKPDPKEYNLGPGVYMFLGYSKGEMEILKPVTSKNELDALTQMEDVLVKDYNFKCTLTLKNHIGENVIAIAKLDINPDIYMNAFIRQRKEKEDCAGPLQRLATKINARPRHSDIMTDAHLSMFILAEVDVNFPEAHTSHSAADHLRPDVALTCLVTLLTALLLHRRYLEAMAPLGVHAT